MKSYFTVETIKIIGPCQEAIENIRAFRTKKKAEVMQRICASQTADFWYNHPWRHFVRRQKPTYDPAKFLEDSKARSELFRDRSIDLFSPDEYTLACHCYEESERVCESLLAAGKMCRDITITVDDWMMVSKWAKT
jgi:hypothetical protein